MAQSAKKQKDITFLWVFIALGMYNFGNMLNVNAQGWIGVHFVYLNESCS